MQARHSLVAIAKQVKSGAAHGLATDAIAALAEASDRALWIDSRSSVAPSYGARIFSGSAAALADLQQIERFSVAAIGPVASLVLGADRALAERVIAQANGASGSLLGRARSALAAGAQAAAANRLATAARADATAWREAFHALTELVARDATTVPSSAVRAAADRALGSKKIALAGPTIMHPRRRLMRAGKPELLFIGAEPCPFCAAERWGLVLALSRFGTFSHLHLVQSSTTERPTVASFTFYGTTYRSRYLSFVPVEVVSIVKRGRGFAPLQNLSKSQSALLRKLDLKNRLPFTDVANRFVNVPSTVRPRLIGGLSWDEIAARLKRPGSVAAQAIAGESQVLTAELCKVTNGRPRSVCSARVVADFRAALPLLDGRGGGCPGPAMAHLDQRLGGQSPPLAESTRCHN